MPRCRIPLFALSLAALPMAATAQEAEVSGARILSCEADRTQEGCATLLSRLFVCQAAPEMEGCADLLALREAATEVAEREAAMNGTEATEDDEAEEGEDDGIVSEPENEEVDVHVRAEGELVDELEEEALTEAEEQLREEDEFEDSDATGRPEADGDDDAETGATQEQAGGQTAAPVTDAVAEENGCPVLASADWAAWINAMPGPDGPQLIVTGTVTLPSPGYSVALEQGPSDRSMRPVQVVELTVQPPAMEAAQVLSDYPVRFEMPSAAPENGTTAPFTAVRVVCGEEELVRIEPIEVAQ